MDTKFDFFPSFIDNRDFRYIIVDGKYIGNLAIVNYPKEAGFLEIIECIPENVTYDLSYQVKKQDTTKILKELTYSISSNNTEIKTNNQNQIDIDILDNVVQDAKSIRKSIQIDNQEIFYVSIIICIYSDTKQNLLNNLKDLQSKLYSKNIISNILNFRQLDSYIATLPLNYIDKTLFNTIYKNFTTNSLSNIFPFYNKNCIDDLGILFGYTNSDNKICCINPFLSKYLNGNMCVFGSSGSGKSYFIKLLIIRNFFINNRQFIIDPEGEYINLITHLSGQVLDFKSNNCYYNVFEITKNDISNCSGNFLEEKIAKVSNLILDLINEQGNKSYTEILVKKIFQIYKNRGITKDINTVLLDKDGKNIYLDKKLIKASNFPKMKELYEAIEDVNLKRKIKINIIDKLHSICEYSNVDMENRLICFNLNNLNLNESISILKYFYSILKNLPKFDKKTLIYFDEVWRYINNVKFNISEEIFSLFKTIRKKNAAIVTITQDVSDFFNYNKGNYGKSILNNSLFKVFFKMEYSDMKILENINLYEKEIFYKFDSLKKGNMFLGFNYNKCFIKVSANQFEQDLMKEE